MKSEIKEGIFEGEVKEFHPALDFKNDKAYVTVRVYTEAKEGLEKKYQVITSDKRNFILSKDALKEEGLYSEILTPFVEDRWSRESINAWLKSKKDFTLKEVFKDLRDLHEFYLDYADPKLYTLLPLWIIGTYFFPLFNAYPYIFLNGFSGSGKSKTGELVAPLAFNGKLIANISDAGLFRTIHLSRGTFILDENEKIAGFGDHSSQMNYLLSGFRSNANVIRMTQLKDKSFVQEEFHLYSPKMIANIRGIKETALLNRTIKLILTPSQKPQAQREINPQSLKIRTLRDKLYVHLMNHWQEVKATRKMIKKMDLNLYGYDFSKWIPILTLAYLLSMERFDEMLQMAKEKVTENKELGFENDNRFRLFSVVRSLSKTDARKVAGNERFYSFDKIYGRYLIEMGITADPHADSEEKILGSKEKIPNYLSKQSVGRMLEHLQIGRENRVLINGHMMRGRWISDSSIKQTQERFGYPDPI